MILNLNSILDNTQPGTSPLQQDCHYVHRFPLESLFLATWMQAMEVYKRTISLLRPGLEAHWRLDHVMFEILEAQSFLFHYCYHQRN